MRSHDFRINLWNALGSVQADRGQEAPSAVKSHLTVAAPSAADEPLTGGPHLIWQEHRNPT